MARRSAHRISITLSELEGMFVNEWAERFPPILNVAQAAALADVSEKTIYDWKHRGLLVDCARRNGRRVRILRDRFVAFLFDKKEFECQRTLLIRESELAIASPAIGGATGGGLNFLTTAGNIGKP